MNRAEVGSLEWMRVSDHSSRNSTIDRLGADAALEVALAVLDHSTDAVYCFDIDARVVYANAGASRLLGYSRDELVGMLITDLNPTYPKEAAGWATTMASAEHPASAAVPPWLKALLAGSASETYETVHRRKDGRLVPIEVSAAAVSAGGRRYIVTATRDVSSRRWMESAVKHISDELDRFFEVSLDMLCITDRRGVFRRLSPSWERVLGFTTVELAAKPLFDFLHPDDRAITAGAFEQLAARPAVVTFANRFEKKSGEYCWLQWRCVADGDRICGAVRDFSARTAGAEAGGTEASLAAARSTKALEAPASGRAHPGLPEERFNDARVLVVEDNRLNQRVARQILEHMGFEVETAGDGREAVELMRRGPDRFDAILMDMQMPEMDGLQATRAIRKEFPKHALPIIAATASVDLTDMTECLNAGMNDCIRKPIDPRHLTKILSRWVTLPPPQPDAAPTVSDQAGRTATSVDACNAVPGIDTTAALERLNGERDLLCRLLRAFVQDHGETTSEIQAAIAKDDYEGALRIVHNLKGVAGTLAATGVFDAARALESGLRDANRTILPGLVDRLGSALDVVRRSVSEWTVGGRPATVRETAQKLDRPRAAAMLAELDKLLKHRRFSARPHFDLLKTQLGQPELLPFVEQVQKHLDRLDFQQARELLPAVASALGVSYPRD